jgi:hypothetical protein
MNKKMLKVACLGFSSIVLCIAQLNAQILTISNTAPTPGSNDIFNLAGTNGATNAQFAVDYSTGSDSGSYYSNNAPAGLPAQSFTTGSNATGYTLTSVTIGVALLNPSANEGIYTDAQDTVAIGTITGGTLNLLYAGTASPTSGATENYGSFVTYTLEAGGLSLDPNTTYVYSFGDRINNTGFFPFALDSNAAYAGGTAMTLNTDTNALTAFTGAGGKPLDAIFDVGLTANIAAVPEPSNIALLGCGLAVLLLGLRWKRQSMN